MSHPSGAAVAPHSFPDILAASGSGEVKAMFALKRIVFCISISVLAAGIAMAQATAELVGKVSDPTGAGVVRSRIVATNTGTGASRETLTESTGDYTLTLLPPGTYNLSV